MEKCIYTYMGCIQERGLWRWWGSQLCNYIFIFVLTFFQAAAFISMVVEGGGDGISLAASTDSTAAGVSFFPSTYTYVCMYVCMYATSE